MVGNPKRVPNSWTGVSRRASANVYAKGASAKVKDALGSNKLSTPAMRPPKDPSAGRTALKNAQRSYSQGNGMNVSFADTGMKEHFYGPLKRQR